SRPQPRAAPAVNRVAHRRPRLAVEFRREPVALERRAPQPESRSAAPALGEDPAQAFLDERAQRRPLARGDAPGLCQRGVRQFDRGLHMGVWVAEPILPYCWEEARSYRRSVCGQLTTSVIGAAALRSSHRLNRNCRPSGETAYVERMPSAAGGAVTSKRACGAPG